MTKLQTTSKLGAPKKTSSQENKELLQTSIWLQYLFKKTSTTDTNRLVEAINNIVEANPSTRHGSWKNEGSIASVKASFRGYRNHETKKPRGIINAANVGVSGSREVYDNHNLSHAINTDNVEGYFRDILKKRQVPFKDISSESTSKVTDNDLKEVLSYTTNLLKESKADSTNNHLLNSYDLSMQLLGNLTILLRFFIKKNQSNDTGWRIEDILAIIINIIETDFLKKHLELPTKIKQEPSHEIRVFYLKWLYETLVDYSVSSDSSINKLSTNRLMPTEDQFIAQPKEFIRLLLKAISLDSKLTKLKASQLIEKKAALWLPNEDFIKDQLKIIIKPLLHFNFRTLKKFRAFKIWFHALVETSKPMKWFNHSVRLTSIASILFFFTNSLLLIEKEIPMALGTSLLCLVSSIGLYYHVSETLKKGTFKGKLV